MTCEDKNEAKRAAKRSESDEQSTFNHSFLRAENEDDDGYDPYSDRREYTPLFERDPWA